MNDEKIGFYHEAHLMVAAIRVFEHLNSRPPGVEELCQLIKMSVEKGSLICRKLEDLEIIKAVDGTYGARLYITDHLKLEDIPSEMPESSMEEELKKFQDSQKAFSRKMETMQAEQKQKKKDLFADMEKKLKAELDKKMKQR